MKALFFSILILFSATSLAVQEIDFMTEVYPPYNFQDEAKKPTGLAVDLLLAMLKEMDIKKTVDDIEVLPWARGYNLAQAPGRLNMLFSTTRTAERETLFKWVGPITDTTIAVFAKKDKGLKIASAADLSTHKWAAVRGGIGSILLGSSGVSEGQINLLNSITQVIKSVDSGRADGFPYESNVARFELKKTPGVDPASYEQIFELKKAQLYFAFNASVDDATIAAYQKALDSVKANSDLINGIMSKY